MQQPPLSMEQTTRLLRKTQDVSHHVFCQRFAFHLLGMQQQEQGEKPPLPLEELIHAPYQNTGQGGTQHLRAASLVFLKPAGLPPCIQPDRPAEPGHGPGFSHAPVAQTRRPAGSPQSSASLAASAWSTRTLGWPSKAVSWRGHPHGVKQGIESPKPTALVPVHQGVISPRHPTEDSRLNEGSTVLFRKESSFDLKPSL